MRRLLTFLGTTNYSETRYRLQTGGSDKISSASRYAAAALAELIGPFDRLEVFATREALDAHWNERGLPSRLPGQAVNTHEIPHGNGELDQWALLTRFREVFKPGDELVIDLTHGFRAQPVIMMMALEYLYKSVGAEVTRLVYGAYEDRSEDVTPFYDLMPMLSLIDWSRSLQIADEMGDLRPMFDLSEGLARRARGREASDRGERPLVNPSDFRIAGELSQALFHCRSRELHPLSRKLAEVLAARRLDFERSRDPASGWLLHSHRGLEEFVAPFAADEISAQVAATRWALKHDHLLQAVVFLREGVLSWAVRLTTDLMSAWEAGISNGAPDSGKRNAGKRADLWRVLVDEAIQLVGNDRKSLSVNNAVYRPQIDSLRGRFDGDAEFLALFDGLLEMRNNFAHGHTHQSSTAASPEKVRMRIESILAEFVAAIARHPPV